ncbi:MAG: DciA family protein [Bacteroidota bacterium]
MKHTGLTTLREALQQMKQRSPHKHKLEAATVAYAWKAAMPKVVRKRTECTFYKHGKLFVRLSSAPLKQELQLNKGKVLALLQVHVQECNLVDIVFL